MDKLSPRWRMRKAALAIHGTAGEFRRVDILNFCAVVLDVLRADHD